MKRVIVSLLACLLVLLTGVVQAAEKAPTSIVVALDDNYPRRIQL